MRAHLLLAHSFQGHRFVGAGHVVVGIQRKSRVESLHRRVEVSAFTVVQTKFAVCAGVFGVDFNGTKQALDGLREKGRASER